ncbi:hypothetical protein [Desulfosporosinus orientis]|uniref:hypothetical protein n=1 Tax=Desulfosporosinus orientis TaxID=1563 RepID=UPI0005A7DF28|nr:hypothetical protein [Desulfosporosinus orientis]
MGFILLVLLEVILLLSAGMTFFGGIRGAVAATVVLSGINYLTHEGGEFWHWEIPLLIGGLIGILLLFLIGKKANKTQVIGGFVGGLSGLIFLGAFATPIVALLIWALVLGTGLIPKYKKSQVLWSLAPSFLRIILGIGWIVYGNLLVH